MSDSEIFKGAESWFSIESNNCTTLVKTGTGGSLKKEEVVNTGCNLVWRVVLHFCRHSSVANLSNPSSYICSYP
jgi:hypothetical protein